MHFADERNPQVAALQAALSNANIRLQEMESLLLIVEDGYERHSWARIAETVTEYRAMRPQIVPAAGVAEEAV